jgi:uncharacterized protein (TIGR03083 family)
MNTEQSWQVIEQQRLAIADLLEGLSPEQWESPSLCAEWRIRDVAAHVSMVGLPPTTGQLLRDGVRVRGNFHRLNTVMTRKRAARSTEQLVADLRLHAASRKLPAVTNQSNILFDVLVHAQDIAVPLGLELDTPPEAARDGATRVWSMGWPFWAKRHLRGLRLTATDVDWSAGSGADVHGPIQALLLLVTGRTATAAPRLSGEGTAQLTRA